MLQLDFNLHELDESHVGVQRQAGGRGGGRADERPIGNRQIKGSGLDLSGAEGRQIRPVLGEGDSGGGIDHAEARTRC